MDSATIHFVGLVLFTNQVMGPAPQVSQQQTRKIEIRSQATDSQAPVMETRILGGISLARGTESKTEEKASSTETLSARPALVREPVVAILPRVFHGNPTLPTTPARQAFRGGRTSKHASPPIHASASHVENHTAMIAFEPSQVVLPIIGWTTQPLGTSSFEYIELAGEQISFVANGVNAVASPDTRLGHAGGAQLSQAFQPPYPGAAAVFMIPRGTLTACTSDTPGVQGRIDTKLALKNQGTFTIKAPGKSITFLGNARVIVANVPLAWAETRTRTASPVSHHKVYCDMTGNTVCDFDLMKPDTANVIAPCYDNLSMRMPNASGQSTNEGKEDPFPMATDVFCSNSQWP